MHLAPSIELALTKVMIEVLQDDRIDRVGYCDLKRTAWSVREQKMVAEPTGSLWQALADCYTVLHLQRLGCRCVHWVLDTGRITGVHHQKVGTLGLLTRGHIETEVLEGHLNRFNQVLEELGK